MFNYDNKAPAAIEEGNFLCMFGDKLWINGEYPNMINRVIFEDSFKNYPIKKMDYLFMNMTNIQFIDGLQNLNAQNTAESAVRMFANSNLDYEGMAKCILYLNVTSVKDMSYMFENANLPQEFNLSQ